MIFIYLTKKNKCNEIVTLFLFFYLISNTDTRPIIYFKTNGIINEMKIKKVLNNEEQLNIEQDNSLQKEINFDNNDKLIAKITKKENQSKISIGLLFQINNNYYDLYDIDYTILENQKLICNEKVIITINDNSQKNILYCSQSNLNEIEITFSIPYNIDCYKGCSQCHDEGNELNHNCISCHNEKGYYFKEDNEFNNCFTKINIGNGYYLDTINKIFKKCNDRCLTCNIGGNDSFSNCTKCKEDYHFDPIKLNHCIKSNELIDINYYLDNNDDKYKICHESCLECSGQNNNCLSCNNTKGYYFKENNENNICYSNNTIEIGYYFNNNDYLFKKCNYKCLTCDYGGSNSSSNCTKCKNIDNYHFDPIKKNHCIKFNELPNISYYLDINDDKYKSCHESCLTCDGPYDNNCTSCNGNTFFEVENFEKCLNYSEIPTNYYGEYSSGKFIYYKCHISCSTCLIGGKNKCQKCNIEEGYFPVEDKTGYCLTEEEIPDKYYLDINITKMLKCHINCDSCSKGFNNITNEMNCDTCINGLYFQNISSTNCVPKPETRYYIDINSNNGQKTLFLCHENCLTCNKGGNDENNECLSCSENLYFDDEIKTNCMDDDNQCAIGCAKCYKNKTNTNYGVLSADKMCKRCSHKMGYFPLEKYSKDQFYVSCYPFNNSPRNYIFDENEKIHKLCYKTCEKCFKIGNNINHSCITCDANYIFIDEEPNNCFPQCNYYYYYNNYKQYKCTESEKCPLEYPYLIANKSKCVENCYKDNEYNLMFKNECLQKCPEGTSAYLYIYNGEFTAKCVDSSEYLDETECKLNIKNNNNLEYDKITEDILQKYAQEYMREYPVANTYVTSYSSSIESLNKYLIVIYKLEKCPKQKVEGYISIGLDECIDKVKTKNTIIRNIVVEIFYIIRKNAPPQIKFFLYHPDTEENLDLSICSGAKLAFKTSIFDNGEVNEELVKFFTNLKINIFDINDPFFTDICFNFAKDGKDVPLDDRIQLYYQNISLCESGCTYVGINLESFEVECSCEVQNTQSNHNGDIAKTFLDNPLSNEVFGVITNSNLEVLKCIKKAFNKNLILRNYGGLMMVGVFLVQIVITCFIKSQIKQVRNYIYSLINELKFPPKRKIQMVKFYNMNNFGNNTIDTNNKQSKDTIVYNSSCNAIYEKNKLKNKQIKNNNINNNNNHKTHIKYQLVKQCSINSFSSINENNKKYTFVKKGSIPYSTQYTNYTCKGINSKNNSSNEINNENFDINNNNGSGSGGSSKIEMGFRINSGASDSALKKLGEIGEESNDEYECEEFKENDNENIKGFFKDGKSFKNYFNERKNIGIFRENDIHKKNSFSSYNSYFDEKENIYNNENGKKVNENGIGIENGMNINENKNDDIPINQILLENGNKNITIYKKNDNNNDNIISNTEKIYFSKKSNKKRKKVKFLEIKNNTTTKKKLENENISKLNNNLRKEINSENKEEHYKKKKENSKNKVRIIPYERKIYSEKEINELDYDDAIIYDKRNYCQIFWCTLKEKQAIVNTFFVKDALKPFSIKLLVIIFSFSCYFVINGFLYNEEYVSTKLKNNETKTFYEYLSDSIERILYTSIVGGVISFIIGILFNTDKKIDKVINKNKKNKIILKGEIAKIYRCNNIRILFFIIIQIILMILFIIYIFCFCYVYPNNKLDWFESSLIVIGLMQSFSLFSSFLISTIKYFSVKFQWELCFKINAYLDDNL